MLRRIRSFFTAISTILLLLTSFLWLHSLHRYDLWSCVTADLDEIPFSGALLGVGQNHIGLNLWIDNNTPPDTACTSFDHLSSPSQSPALRDGRETSSYGGFTLAHGARFSSNRSYFGLVMPCWLPLLLFGLLPTYGLLNAIRRRSPFRILSRLITALSLTSAAFAVFLAMTWFKSFEYDHVAVPEKYFSENHAWFLSSQGITYWYFFDEPLRLQRPIWFRFPADRSSSRLAGTMDPASRFLGFGRTRSTYMHSSLFAPAPRPYTIIAVPYYALLVIALALPTGTLVHYLHFLVRRRRKTKGLCPNCGYDMRATPTRCPECGHSSTLTSTHGALQHTADPQPSPPVTFSEPSPARGDRR
jgi:hypothetical protein